MDYHHLQTDVHKLRKIITESATSDDRQVMRLVNHELVKIKLLERLKSTLLQSEPNHPDIRSIASLISKNQSLLSSLVLEVDARFNTHYSPWFSLRLGKPQVLPPVSQEPEREAPRVAMVSKPLESRQETLNILPVKSLMAIERTFLSWVNIWIAIAAFSLYSQRNQRVSLCLSIIGIWASFWIFLHQAKLIKSDVSSFKGSVLIHAITTVAFLILAVSEI